MRRVLTIVAILVIGICIGQMMPPIQTAHAAVGTIGNIQNLDELHTELGRISSRAIDAQREVGRTQQLVRIIQESGLTISDADIQTIVAAKIQAPVQAVQDEYNATVAVWQNPNPIP